LWISCIHRKVFSIINDRKCEAILGNIFIIVSTSKNNKSLYTHIHCFVNFSLCLIISRTLIDVDTIASQLIHNLQHFIYMHKWKHLIQSFFKESSSISFQNIKYRYKIKKQIKNREHNRNWKTDLRFKLLQLGLRNCVGLCNNRNDVDLGVQYLHGDQIKSFHPINKQTYQLNGNNTDIHSTVLAFHVN